MELAIDPQEITKLWLKNIKKNYLKIKRKLKKPLLKDRNRLLTRLQIQSKKLQYKIARISDVNLDTLVLAHPLMGKMTIKEIIMWTVYHTQQHTESLQKNYTEEIFC